MAKLSVHHLSDKETEDKNGDTSVEATVEITCTTCYITGTVTAQLTVDPSFNASQEFHSFIDEVEHGVGNVTAAIVGSVKADLEDLGVNFKDHGFDFDDYTFPPINMTLDIDIPSIPQCQLQFQFNGMELYVLIDIELSAGATYTLNLFSTENPLHLPVGDDFVIGVNLSLDLILSVEAEIDITSGFHIKLEDGLAIGIPLFDTDLSSITL